MDKSIRLEFRIHIRRGGREFKSPPWNRFLLFFTEHIFINFDKSTTLILKTVYHVGTKILLVKLCNN